MEKKRKIESAHSLTKEQIFERLQANEKGLDEKQVNQRKIKYGLNEIIEKRKNPYLRILLNQFKSLFIYILLLAAIISFFVKHYIDVYLILGVILINGTIGFFQERKAENAIKALKKRIVSYAKVYRNNTLVKINSKELVPGDIILLEEGDKIPADARLFSVKNFKTIEASLTGESFPVEKNIKTFLEKISLGDRKNMVFLGTYVASGKAKAIVVSTGDYTEIGEIAKSIEQVKTKKSHFKQKVDNLALKMTIIALTGSMLIFLIGFFVRKMAFTEIFIFGIASLVSGIPEGLPAVLTIVLAIGALRMAKKKAIIRNLASTETLGVVNTIITDKTGTLTKNIMTVRKIILASAEEINVTGEAWKTKGEFYKDKKQIDPITNLSLYKLLDTASLCSNAKLDKKTKDLKIIGDPTEVALSVMAEKAKITKKTLENKYNILDEMPFNQELKYKASLVKPVKGKSNSEIQAIGAPENLFEKCSYFYNNGKKQEITKKYRQEIAEKTKELARQAMRVIALAYKEVPLDKKSLNEKDVNDLIFLGMVAMNDPPRPEVKQAIEKAKKSGIRIIMVTGDHIETAISIAKEIGLIEKHEKQETLLAMTGQELEKLSASEFKKTINQKNIFARLTPTMKLRIASELQTKGQTIAMTGDGVNDAPALKQADMGISMGITGTDVARESSEMVLADDNFATIINAIEEGRIVFNNTKKTSFFLVTTNVAEDITLISTLILGMPLPLLPTQILWLNLVTDTGPGLGLAVEPGHSDMLDEKPKSSKENILNLSMLPFLILMSGLMIVLTIIIFKNFYPQGIEKARTGAFAVMALTQIFNSLNMRSLKKSVFKIGFFKNKTLIIFMILSLLGVIGVMYFPFLQSIFKFQSLSVAEFMVIFALSSSVFFVGESYKLIANMYNKMKNRFKIKH